jgi:hypothetical protein
MATSFWVPLHLPMHRVVDYVTPRIWSAACLTDASGDTMWYANKKHVDNFKDPRPCTGPDAEGTPWYIDDIPTNEIRMFWVMDTENIITVTGDSLEYVLWRTVSHLRLEWLAACVTTTS